MRAGGGTATDELDNTVGEGVIVIRREKSIVFAKFIVISFGACEKVFGVAVFVQANKSKLTPPGLHNALHCIMAMWSTTYTRLETCLIVCLFDALP